MVYPTVKYAVNVCGKGKDDVPSVALAIFQDYELKLETSQGQLPIVAFSTSSFSQEDLPSDLVGFYMALNKWKRKDVESLLGTKLSVAEAQKLYMTLGGDLGSAANKNKTFAPVDHNQILDNSPAAPKLQWPKALSTIYPAEQTRRVGNDPSDRVDVWKVVK